jgi:hypothetical protein
MAVSGCVSNRPPSNPVDVARLQVIDSNNVLHLCTYQIRCLQVFVELRQGDITMLPGLIRVYVYMCSYKCLDDTPLAALGRRAWSFTYASKRLCSPLDSGERARIYSHAVGRWVAPRVTALPDRPDRIDTPMLSLFSPPRMPHPDSSSSHLHRKDPVTLHVDNVARPCRHLDM